MDIRLIEELQQIEIPPLTQEEVDALVAKELERRRVAAHWKQRSKIGMQRRAKAKKWVAAQQAPLAALEIGDKVRVKNGKIVYIITGKDDGSSEYKCCVYLSKYSPDGNHVKMPNLKHAFATKLTKVEEK